MSYDPNIHHRRSIRLKSFDYRSEKAYFVTLCVQDRECLLGEIVNGVMNLSEVGEAVSVIWHDLPHRFPFLQLDTFCIMPNHLHAILLFQSPEGSTALPDKTLGEVLRAFKSLSGIQGNRLLDRSGRPFWQRNYYERVLRNEHEHTTTQRYILDNPLNWETDDLHRG